MRGLVSRGKVCARLFGRLPAGSAQLRSDSGNISMFSLSLFFVMATMGGLAVDIMRYEQIRTTLQSTLDRSTLAAASLTQELDPEAVVRDYFQAAGLQDSLTSVEVSEGINFRNVVAKASVDSNPYFLHMLGIDGLDVPGNSGAEQRISNVEIVLVLDVSGSMGGSRMTNLKVAATEFVDTLLKDDVENRFSIAIVPYNAEVNLGETLRSKYNATHLTDNPASNCLELPTSVYSTISVSRTLAIPMVSHADVVSSTGSSSSNTYNDRTSTSSATLKTSEVHCSVNTGNVVRLPSNNVTALKSQINALFADGNTSITLGMKWGLSLIDPDSRPMFT